MSRSSEDDAFRHSMRGLSPEPPSAKAYGSPKPDKGRGEMAIASPSASILLLSPTNRILLLHRVHNSTSFASAHVFPGGHLSAQDGPIPPLEDLRRHEDSTAYRHAAIRECFEESGLLLAKRQIAAGGLVELTDQERDEGRKAVHSEDIPFQEWVKQRDGVLDTDGLVPFTRWLTPANLPKRFSTQMYLYFLPVNSSSKTDKAQMHIPTPDGGIEHTAARFLYPQDWIDLALSGKIVLFPPQFFLLALIAPFLSKSQPTAANRSTEAMLDQRERLLRFVKEDGDPAWGEKCISPNPIKKTGKYLFMGLDDAGPELQGTHRRGDPLRLIRVELAKDKERGRQRPKPQEVVWRKDFVGEEKGKL